jgi:hypothetical protein
MDDLVGGGPKSAPDMPGIIPQRTSMSFGLYMIGFLVLITGLIYGAVLLHLAAHWIVVGAIVLLGLGILKGVQATRGRDSSH